MKSQPKPFHSVYGLAAIIVSSTVLVWLAPWASETFMPSLGLGLRWQIAVALALAYGLSSLLTLLFKKLAFSRSLDDDWLMLSRHMPRQKVAEEVRAVSPYLDVMNKQLDGAVKETEHGVIGLIGSLNSIHTVSDQQFHRIQATQESGAELSAALKEKALVDNELGSILQMFIEKQHQDVQTNLGRIKRLQEVKSLTSLVGEISLVAKQTNILSINAAVEAARAGDAGRGFAVLAAEIRQLSNRTAEAAVNISHKIKTATEGIDEELRVAVEVDGRNTATDDMRHVITKIDNMQRSFSASSQSLLEIIDGVKTGHQIIVEQLSEALGKIQFQDVIRQRVEQVQTALGELDDHLQSMADQMVDSPWDPETMVTMHQRLENQVASYVMQSQREAHEKETGKNTAPSDDRPKIELF